MSATDATAVVQPSAPPATGRAQFIPHVTQAGERWDLLAWRYYGDPLQMGPIIDANPVVPIYAVFPAGVTLAIPIISVPAIDENDTPPWGTL